MSESKPTEDIIHVTEDDLPPETMDLILTEEEIQNAAAEYTKQNPCLDFTVYQDVKPSEVMKFYDRLRRGILDWAETKGIGNKYLEYILLAPDFFLLLIRLMMDQRVDGKLRAILVGIAAYFISPIDPMPEALLGPIGYLDDVVVTALGILMLLKNTDENIIREHWSGKGDIVEIVKKFAGVGESLMGSALWKALRQKSKIDEKIS